MIIKCISVYLFIGVILLAIMFVYSFLKGKSSYAKALGALSLTIQVYIFGYLMEINSVFLKDMIFWNIIQYFGIPFFPALWLVVSMLYTGRGKYLKGFRGLFIFGIPIVTFIIRLTNDWHFLFYRHIERKPFLESNIMLLTKGPWYFIHTGYVLIVLLLCSWFYFQRYRNSIGDEKIQFRLLLLASMLPYIALVLNAMNIGVTGIDYAALILPFCILIINLTLTRYNFLEFKVLAREKVFEDSSAGLVLLNHLYRIVDYNEASILFFKWFHTQIKEEPLERLLKEQEDLLNCIKRSENRVFTLMVDGEERYVHINIKEVRNKVETVGILLTFEDVTEYELLRHRLIEMASIDELSGLYNRRSFRAQAQKAFQRACNSNEHLYVLMMDIDYFKKINDSYGHMVGDAVIQEFSKTLNNVFQGDIVGRVGGEEFAVVMRNSNAMKAYKKAECFRHNIEEKHMTLGEQQVNVSVSIGVAEWTEENLNFDILMSRADSALYKAKQSGRNCTVVFTFNDYIDK